jgi:hypothetical protein
LHGSVTLSILGEDCQSSIRECGNLLTEQGDGHLNDNNASKEKTPEPAAGKKTYQTPTLRFESVFEVSALACGKLTGSTSSSCHFSTKSS